MKRFAVTRILERALKKLRTKEILIVKVLWSHHGVKDATWETEEFLRRKHPEFPLSM